MAAKKNPDLVGHMDCTSCGSEMPVYQAVNSYLYTRCAQCGVDQRNGARVQAERWFTMRRIDGAGTRPVNVPEEMPGWLRQVETEPEAAAPKVDEPKVQEQEESESGGGGAFWGLLALFGVGVGLMVKAVV